MKSEDPEMRREKEEVMRQIIRNRSQKLPIKDGYSKKAVEKFDDAKNGQAYNSKNCKPVEWGYLPE